MGRLFVADGSSSPIGVSEDGGNTWSVVPPPPPASDWRGTWGDTILQVAPSGRLYWSALFLSQGFVLEGIQVAWSDDGGKTWAGNVHLGPAEMTPQVVAPDRQWLGFAPDGSVYLTYNQVPSGIWLARSDDEGRTWTSWTRAAPVEGRKGGIGQSGPPVVDSSGRVFVPACEGDWQRTLVLRSDDKGATWASAAVEGGCSWFPILAVGAGSVVLSVQPAEALVSVSTDGGVSFPAPKSWGSPATSSGWPILTPDGKLILAWFKDEGDGVAVLHVSRGVGSARDADIAVVSVHGGTEGNTAALTDFASAALLPDGSLAVVFAKDNQVLVAVES